MRKTSDGDILFPHKGIPPVMIPGYVKDASDPWVFHPIRKVCKFRVFKTDTADCCSGKTRTLMYCNLFEKTISWNICSTCDKNET
jgi:hypothetical protein